MNNTNKTFCVLPWTSIAVDPSGNIQPCCISTDSIKKTDGTPYNLGVDKIADIYNSPDYVTMRQKMLAGTEVGGCKRCYQMEKSGDKSHREVYNATFSIQSPKSLADPNIAYFDLRFGNLCNLNCRSCSPKHSSQLAKEVAALKDSTNIAKFLPIKKIEIDDWYNSATYEENISVQYKNIKLIYLTGGEPTIISKNFETLSSLIELGYSKSIWLKISTNMTNTNFKFYELFPKFKSVIVLASIDGYGNMQEYLRYPSNWEQIDNNLRRLSTVGNNIFVRPAPIIQITNLNKIVDLFEYFEAQNRSANKMVFDLRPIILETPKHLNLVHLPREFKIKSWEKIENWLLDKCKFQSTTFKQTMLALKYKCYQASETPERLIEYVEFNSILDNNRNHHLIEINPELHSVLTQ